MIRSMRVITSVLALLSVLLLTFPALAIDGSGAPAGSSADYAPYVLGADTLDLEEESRGYSTEYMFGMSKAIRRSTLNPALKPAVWIVTVPLDIVFLPFAALGGFF
jgi:hypothetical protein